MKQTVAISAFAGMLARQSGYTVDFCERFVIEMFKTVADALKESSSVSIKGLGKFTVDDSGNVKFLPDDSFAAEINAPFDCFEPELLDDSATEEMLLLDNEAESENGNVNDVTAGADGEDVVEENASTDENASENGTPCEEEVIEDAVQYDDAVKTSTDYAVATDGIDTVVNDAADEAPSEVSSNAASKTDGLSVGKAEDNAEINDVKHEETGDCHGPEFSGFDDEKVTDTKKTHKVRWFASGIAVGAIIGAASVYFISGLGHDAPSAAYISENDVTVAVSSDSAKSMPTDMPIDMPAEPAPTVAVNNMTPEPKAEVDTVVYDYVTSTLAQLSRKHYGSYEFWVYIYEENKDVISNPDRVEPDTRVRIPSPEKYGINAKDKASIKAALKKSQELAVKKNDRK